MGMKVLGDLLFHWDSLGALTVDGKQCTALYGMNNEEKERNGMERDIWVYG